MRFYLYYIGLFVFLFCNGLAQHTIKGTVFSSKGSVVEGAEVDLAGVRSQTDAAGNFSIDSVSSGTHTLTVFLTGFKRKSFFI